MNERIEKLAEQSLQEATSLGTSYYSGTLSVSKGFTDKFAELIIKECARIARATPCPYEEEEVKQRLGHTWDMASLEAGRCISKHFGLEK
jgi:hypothetical protein